MKKYSFEDGYGREYAVSADKHRAEARITINSEERVVTSKDAPKIATLLLSSYHDVQVVTLADKRQRVEVGYGVRGASYLVPKTAEEAEWLLNDGLAALTAYNGFISNQENELAEELDNEAAALCHAYYGDEDVICSDYDLAAFRRVAQAARKLAR